MRWIYVIAAALVLAAVTGVTVFWSVLRGDAETFASCREGAVAGNIGGEFTLVNGAGETVTSEALVSEPTLVYFGYTFCPDVCPFDTVRNAAAIDLLAEEGVEAQNAFITVDPARDTPEVVGEFAQAIHPEMIGLTGSPEQIREAAEAFRVIYQVPQDPEDEYYLVNHTTFTYLLMPEEGFVDYFRREAPAEQIAERVACFAEAA
ncbi:SCO family protein [Roseivivax sp.]